MSDHDGYCDDYCDECYDAGYEEGWHDRSRSRSSSGKNSGGGNSDGCYVATAVYGSYDCPEVWTLRRFRDFHLRKSMFGRAFVKFYYAVSPGLVHRFGTSGFFQKTIRRSLDKFVAWLQGKGFEDTPYFDRS